MADPVSRAGAARITYNEALERGAERTYQDKIPVNQPKSSELERARAAAAESSHGGKTVVEHVVVHKAAHGKLATKLANNPWAASPSLLKKAAGLPGSLLGKALPGVATLHVGHELFSVIAGKPEHSADQKALVREHFSQGTALLAQAALPAGYVKARVTDEAQARGRLTEAVESLRVKLGSMEKADALMTKFAQEAQRSAFEGVQYGVAYEVRSQADLDQLLTREKSLGERFKEDLAFREGMLSVVWLAKNNPADYEARRGLMVSQQSAASRAR